MTKIGVLLPTREAVMYGDQSGDPRPLIELARQVEAAGLDSVWVGDSLLAKPRAEPLTMLAAVAAVTERVELGTAVILTAMRDATQLAQAAATVDAISGGRLILGIGGGPAADAVQADFERIGADFSRRSSQSVQAVLDARALWAGAGGEQMYPLPARVGGPPMWIGGDGPRTLQRTAHHANGWFPISATPEKFSAGLTELRANLDLIQRDPAEVTIAAYLTVNIGDQATAQAELEEHSQLYYGAPHSVIGNVQASIAGSAAQVGDWVSRYIDAGAEHVCIRFASPDYQTQLERLVELAPSLRNR